MFDLIFARLVTLRAGTHTRGAPTRLAIHSALSRQQFTPRRVATITMYDSVERGAADECKPLRGRRPRTFTLTQLLVACVAVCGCTLAATTAVNTHLVNTHEDYPEGAQLGGRGRRPYWTTSSSDLVRCVGELRQRRHQKNVD